jgi:hypothetical protein
MQEKLQLRVHLQDKSYLVAQQMILLNLIQVFLKVLVLHLNINLVVIYRMKGKFNQ